MIIKKNTNLAPSDKFGRAGYEAERNVAYKLEMAFGDSPSLLILNDLRIEFEDDITAQMDHLIIHQHGVIIIESKSVAGRLQVQDDGQWVVWRSQKAGKDSINGMDNPIKQAKNQGKTLRQVLLKSASNEHTRKVLEDFHTDVLVAFSTKNGGTFLAKDNQIYPEVCPDHAVDDRINEIVKLRTKDAKTQNSGLSEMYRVKLAEHLVKIHKPYQELATTVGKPYPKPSVANVPVKIEQKISEYIVAEKLTPTSIMGAVSAAISSTLTSTESKFKHNCRKCESDKLEASSGKFGYYFKCLDCNENNTIKTSCQNCKSLLKIRKDKKQFFVECSACKTSELFYINR